MQKKITLILMALLMINMYIGVMYADDENTVGEQQVIADENTVLQDVNEESNIKVFEAKAAVIEAGEVRKVSNGFVEDTVQTIKVEILNGEYKSKQYTIDYFLSYDVEGKILAYELNKGDKVLVQIAEEIDGNVSVTIEEFQRANYVMIMFVILLVMIIAIGGRKGVRAVIGFIVTILVLYYVLIKAIFAGTSAIFSSIMTCLIVTALIFFITVGINKKSLIGTIGSFGGTLIAGGLVIIFGHLAKLSGSSEEAIQLSINLKTIEFNFRELIFATILVSSIGACMDIALSMVNGLDEVRSKTENFTWKELFFSGMKIGREVIGTMSNTLFFVYIGGLMKLLLLYMACNIEIGYIMSKEAVAEQLILAIAGTMGGVCTVPITALFYAFINKNKTIYKTTSENKIDGKRSLKI